MNTSDRRCQKCAEFVRAILSPNGSGGLVAAAHVDPLTKETCLGSFMVTRTYSKSLA